MVELNELKQPQLISADDGKMQIINHFPYRDRFGSFCIDGAVRYASAEPNLYAEIKADYFDIDQELIDTEVETVSFLKPGGTSAFWIMYSGLRRGEVQYYKLYVTVKKE